MLNSLKLSLMAVALLSISVSSCGESNMEPKASALSESLQRVDWKKIASKRIYFGHQSVGNNVLNGLRLIAKEHPNVALNIVETTDPNQFTRPIFAHSPVGRNEQPETKNAAFAELLTGPLRGKPEIAFYKYCYIDVTRRTDPVQLFNAYKATMERVKAANPATTLVHVTAPLTVIQTGPKAWLKRALGKPVAGYEENKRRQEFNEMLRAEYGNKKEPIFDLAAFESTLENGERVSYQHGGQTYYALAPEYSDDGGHLNERGQKFVAAQLLIFLSAIPEPTPQASRPLT